MLAIIEEKQEQLHQLCIKYKIKKIELFGSALKGNFNPKSSDLDFLVQFYPLTPSEYSNNYFELKENLEKLFDRPVDLLESEVIHNPYLLETIESNRKILYVAEDKE